MKRVHDPKHLRQARKELRNNPTPQEEILWQKLKGSQLGFKFKRQHGIHNFIVDFYCAQKKLIIEIDGSDHLDKIEADQERTNYINSLGYKVLRFWNNEVSANLEGVVMKIKEMLR